MENLSKQMLTRLDAAVEAAIGRVEAQHGVKANVTLALTIERDEKNAAIIYVNYRLKSAQGDVSDKYAGHYADGQMVLPSMMAEMREAVEG